VEVRSRILLLICRGMDLGKGRVEGFRFCRLGLSSDDDEARGVSLKERRIFAKEVDLLYFDFG
jgi:hypothetical protein